MGKFDLLKRVAKSRWTHGIIGATAVPLGMDTLMHGGDNIFNIKDKGSTWNRWANLDFDKKKDTYRLGIGAWNSIFGAAAGGALKTSPKAHLKSFTGPMLSAGLIGSLPLKDLAFKGMDWGNKMTEAQQSLAETAANKAKAEIESLKDEADTRKAKEETDRLRNVLLGVSSAGALGIGGAAALKYISKKDEPEDKAKVKFILPGVTGDPDSRALVEMPIDSPDLYQKQLEGIQRSVRNQASKSLYGASKRTDPTTGKLIPIQEWEDKYGATDIGMAVANSYAEKPTSMQQVYGQPKVDPYAQYGYNKVAYVIEKYETGETMEKYASTAKDEVVGIMDTIYNENPEYWPYGLTADMHKEVYLVRDAFTKEAAGFVGWQDLPENGKRIGSYTMGILPEFRGRGFAKEAVAKIIMKKAATVDEVRHYVVDSNVASKGVAQSVGIPATTKF